RTFHGTRRVVPDPGRRRDRRREIRSRLVRELGARMGGIRKSFRCAHHHGRVLFDHYDRALQSARPRIGLAKRDDQMVTVAATEASSLRVREVRKSFPTPENPFMCRLALDAISVSLAAGELVSLVGPS